MNDTKKLVWIDTDPAFGDEQGDCDDGYAMIALFHSKQIDIVGISAVFGNTYVANAYQKLLKLMTFESKLPPIYWGAQDPLQLNVHTKLAPDVALITTDASQALSHYLIQLEPGKKLTIVAIGALTNIATVLLLHPELEDKIESVIVIAGRYSVDQLFYFGTKQISDGKAPFRDLNFDVNPDAFRALLQRSVKVVLVGVEVARKLWLYDTDLKNFQDQGSSDIAYMAAVSSGWLKLWKGFGNEIDDSLQPILNSDKEKIPVHGFNPFDLLAASYAINPDWFIAEERAIELPLALDDTQLKSPNTSFKYYLVAPPQSKAPKRVTYLKDVSPKYSQDIKALLLKPECS
jgi:inosine-uridine nucleoside N-ribohydrolase